MQVFSCAALAARTWVPRDVSLDGEVLCGLALWARCPSPALLHRQLSARWGVYLSGSRRMSCVTAKTSEWKGTARRQFSRWFVLWRRDYESAAGMVRDMMGLLKNLLALTSLAVESSHFHKTENTKTNRCVFKFDRICKSCNFLAKMVWSIEMMILVSTEICQKLMLRRFQEGFAPGKTCFFLTT